MNKIAKYITKSMVAGLLLAGGLPALKADHHGAKGVDAPLRGEKRIREAVESGKITKEEARKRLEAMRKAAGKRDGGSEGRGRPKGGSKEAELKRKYQAAEKEVWEAVKAGKISKEDGEKKLKEIGQALRNGHRGGGKEAGASKKAGGGKEAELKRKYQAAEKEVWEAVKAGKISKEDGEKKLKEIGQALRNGHRGGGKEAGASKKAGGGKEAELKRKYQAAEMEIRAAVKAGKASKEEGEKRLAHLKEKLFGGSEKKDWDEKKGSKKASDAGIEALKRELEALKRENEGLRRRLEKGKGR